ncbi:hypothetical protein FOCC_FOCC009042 [Frankliniella occidentalis]|nr:hypothetical protein FOCC_FOCC009042 [Frankliniella occidentalis]
MTEVVSPAHQVISVRRYEAAPVPVSGNTELVDPDNLLATNKEEGNILRVLTAIAVAMKLTWAQQ